MDAIVSEQESILRHLSIVPAEVEEKSNEVLPSESEAVLDESENLGHEQSLLGRGQQAISEDNFEEDDFVDEIPEQQARDNEQSPVRNETSARHGRQHGRPYKISMVLNGMNELLNSEEPISKKQACRKLAEEYNSTPSTI